MPIINKRWDGNQFRTGATFRRWTGSAWKSGATVRTWNGSDWVPGFKFEAEGGHKFVQGAYTYHAFRDVGQHTLTVKGTAHKIEWIIVGGGGSGGDSAGGGAATLNHMGPTPGYLLEKGVYNIYVGDGKALDNYKKTYNGDNSFIEGIPIALSKGGGAPAYVYGTAETTKYGSTGGSSGGITSSHAPYIRPADKTPSHGGVQTYANIGGCVIQNVMLRDSPYTTTLAPFTGIGGGGGAGGPASYYNGGAALTIPGWYSAPGVQLGPLCGGGAGALRSQSSGSAPYYQADYPKPGVGGGKGGSSGAANTGSGGGHWIGDGHYPKGGSGVVYIRYLTP